MSKFEAFFKNNVKAITETKEVKLDRFSEPIKMRALSAAAARACSDRASKVLTNDKGKITETLDVNTYNFMLLANTIVEPDFDDAQLQDSYGVRSAEQLVGAMFTQKEYLKLLDVAAELNAKGNTNLVEQAKN